MGRHDPSSAQRSLGCQGIAPACWGMRAACVDYIDMYLLRLYLDLSACVVSHWFGTT